jgi:hypothetical protein
MASRGRKARAAIAVALGVGLACEPIVGDPAPAAPINSCPEHPCEAYKQPGVAPSCVAGVCTVAAPAPNLLLVIGLATDSFLAPGRTYLTTLNGGPSASGPCAVPSCSPPLCALPKWDTDQSSYLLYPNAASPQQANWDLGNPSTATSLPVTATYRPLFGATKLPDGTSEPQDAIDLGLPLEPVLAVNFTTPSETAPGPNKSAQQQFRAYMQPLLPGCYERTLQPVPPYSTAFPPEIKPWPPDDQSPISNFDVTREEALATGQGPSVPQFDLQRAEGLDGWTAYLRDIRTKRVFSNVAPLKGSLAQGVTLLTNHEPTPQIDALTNLELVMAPPAGQPLPTEVFAPVGMPGAQELPVEPYPSLPTPVTVTGRIQTPAGTPVPAEVFFTATDITDPSGQPYPPNFEFAATVSTTKSARTGVSSYSLLLPRGDYQVAVRPTDASNAVTVGTRAVGDQGNLMTGQDFDVAPLVAVSGNAIVADGRPLAEAIVEVVPTACASSSNLTGPASTATSCLPRPAQTNTENDGSFALAVDPGQYLLRVRPRQGSRLPWNVQSIVVGATPLLVGEVVIPAPVSVGMHLTDQAGEKSPSGMLSPNDNPVPNAVVRVFTDPSLGGPAIELGQAITDSDGQYEMYLALPVP